MKECTECNGCSLPNVHCSYPDCPHGQKYFVKEETKPIPISAGEHIAKEYGYDQVIIIARKVGDKGNEHVTTYGRDKANCNAAAIIGDFLKYKVMGWPKEKPNE